MRFCELAIWDEFLNSSDAKKCMMELMNALVLACRDSD